MEDIIERYISNNHECYDRYTFDKIFRFLLLNEFSNEEAKDYILFNCSLSAIIFQERIDNDFYKLIEVDEKLSSDLLKERNEFFIAHIPDSMLN